MDRILKFSTSDSEPIDNCTPRHYYSLNCCKQSGRSGSRKCLEASDDQVCGLSNRDIKKLLGIPCNPRNHQQRDFFPFLVSLGEKLCRAAILMIMSQNEARDWSRRRHRIGYNNATALNRVRNQRDRWWHSPMHLQCRQCCDLDGYFAKSADDMEAYLAACRVDICVRPSPTRELFGILLEYLALLLKEIKWIFCSISRTEVFDKRMLYHPEGD